MMKARRRRKRALFRKIYKQLLRQYKNATQPVPAKVHGYDVLLNPGNNYPFIIQDTPLFNASLVELVFQSFTSTGSPQRFVDVGAATGDTVLLLKQKCPNQVLEFVCIEGDAEFFGLLSQNMAQFENVKIVQTMLSREPMQVRSLVKHHSGTAAAIGNDFVIANPLDAIREVRAQKVDVLKIDVDGFDGAVLTGAKDILKKDQPAVIFEWHPKLLKATGNDPIEPFGVLEKCGYKRYLWFNNIGTFSHFSEIVTAEILKNTADYLLKVNHRADEHFDVIALPDTSNINPVELAALNYSQSR